MPIIDRETARADRILAAQDPKRIWLGPKCESVGGERTWSSEPQDCDDCGMKAVEYIRADQLAEQAATMTQELEKRKWCYLQPPSTYEIAPCACGNGDTQWSEYKGRLWCAKCEIDFVPEHNGIFDGPTPVATSAMLGIFFDRINLATNEVEPFEIDPVPQS